MPQYNGMLKYIKLECFDAFVVSSEQNTFRNQALLTRNLVRYVNKTFIPHDQLVYFSSTAVKR
jgi:hypothetical protein